MVNLDFFFMTEDDSKILADLLLPEAFSETYQNAHERDAKAMTDMTKLVEDFGLREVDQILAFQGGIAREQRGLTLYFDVYPGVEHD